MCFGEEGGLLLLCRLLGVQELCDSVLLNVLPYLLQILKKMIANGSCCGNFFSVLFGKREAASGGGGGDPRMSRAQPATVSLG